jgi:hypothetical protein
MTERLILRALTDILSVGNAARQFLRFWRKLLDDRFFTAVNNRFAVCNAAK